MFGMLQVRWFFVAIYALAVIWQRADRIDAIFIANWFACKAIVLYCFVALETSACIWIAAERINTLFFTNRETLSRLILYVMGGNFNAVTRIAFAPVWSDTRGVWGTTVRAYGLAKKGIVIKNWFFSHNYWSFGVGGGNRYFGCAWIAINGRKFHNRRSWTACDSCFANGFITSVTATYIWCDA